MGQERIWRIIYTKVYREKRFFEENVPREYKSIYELLKERRPGVYLVSGLFHEFDPSDVRRAADQIPWYLHRLVKFPWVFLYRRSNVGRFFLLVKPDNWAARALHYVLRGSLANELWEIRDSEMNKLLALFKSLIMVSLVYNIERERGEAR